jgi:hypothetical protein
MANDNEVDGGLSVEPQSGFGAPGVGLIDYVALPEGTTTRSISFKAPDGGSSRGILHARGGEQTVVCISHPRADMSQHYAIPQLIEAGFACYSHQCRGLNNDIDCVHEELLLDLATGYRHLKTQLGFEKIVLLGNSGGGSLFSFYQAQASKVPKERVMQSPAGDPTLFDRIEMPKADGLMFIAVHPGEGVFMLDEIDPSIPQEGDPLSVDPALDMYDPENGFREPPEPSRYSASFLECYRAAQRGRVARLDAKARGHIAEQNRYKKLLSDGYYESLPLREKIYLSRRANVGYYMTIYRTEANPAYCDLTLKSWRSTRTVGSVVGPRPDVMNYARGGHSRCITPRAWLSSWSGLSSNAAIEETIKFNEDPLLIVAFTGDHGCFPEDNKRQLDVCPSEDKEMAFSATNHFGYPLIERTKAVDLLVQWMKKRYPHSA